jgi:cytochrome c peroxidase
MKKFWILLPAGLIILFWTTCSPAKNETVVDKVLQQYHNDITDLLKAADTLVIAVETGNGEDVIQQRFVLCRFAYKQIEWLAEYYQPYTAKFINGPALEEVEPDDKWKVIQPEGFQVIEELIYPVLQPEAGATLLQEVKTLRSNLGRLQVTAATLQTTDAHLFDAFRLQVFRILSLGVTGFDSPVARNSIAEAEASITGLQRYVSFYRFLLEENDSAFAQLLDQVFVKTKNYLSLHPDFDAFDRMQFARQFANPLSITLLQAQNRLGFPAFQERRPLRADAKHLFAADAFDPDFYAPGTASYASEEKRELGRRLFHDPILSLNGKRSCGSCHQPGKAFADALKTNTALNSGLALKRNTPSLFNAALQPSLFYDTRVAYLEDQAEAVILNKEEMHGSLAEAVDKLRAQEGYREHFKKAYAATGIREQSIKNALAVYVRSLLTLNSRFDRYMRGETDALQPVEIKGYNLFMGKAKCGTCHFAPLFNGSNPPQFTKIDAEVIGVPATTDTLQPKLDPDEGKFYALGIPHYRFAFKTPTVRNSGLTAPYMHNGVYNTLEEVVAFYNRGGGRGLGIPIENQTLPEEKLNLTMAEQKAIVAFMHSLNDTSSYHVVR